MNYIKRIQEELEQSRKDMKYVTDWMFDLERYLLSSKFHVDPTVQTGDILLRLNELAQGLLNPDLR